MTKNLLYVFMAAIIISGCMASYDIQIPDETYSDASSEAVPIKIDDPAFRAFCLETFDTAGKGYVSQHEVSRVTRLDCSGRGIKSLEGIEQFTALDTLICKENLIGSLNLSRTRVSVLYACPMDDAEGRNLLDYLYVLEGQNIEYVTSDRRSAPDKRIPDKTVVVAIPAAKVE